MKDQLNLFELPKFDTPETTQNQIGNPRLLKPIRNQVEMNYCSIDDMLDKDHPIRNVWRYVENLDLSKKLLKIKSIEGHVGRPAIDPKILVSLWLYATIEGIGAASVIAQRVKDSLSYKWLCGDVPVEVRTISQFRADNGDLFEDILIQGIVILQKSGLVELKEIAHDGLRVRAHASKDTFKDKKSIKLLLKEAKERVSILKRELEEDKGKHVIKVKERELRHAESKLKVLKDAQNEVSKFIDDQKKSRRRNRKKNMTKEEKDEVKISITDPEARIMKLPGGGFRPAYNFQYAVDTATYVVVGVDVVQARSDNGQLYPMYKKIKKHFGVKPEKYLADGGYKKMESIEKLEKDNCEVYLPVQSSSKNNFKPQKNESEELQNWRNRMSTDEGKQVYKRRASTIECINARFRNLGLYKVLVRGLKNVRNVANIFAIAHNMSRTTVLGAI